MKTISNELIDRNSSVFVTEAPLGRLSDGNLLLKSNYRRIELTEAENQKSERKESLENVINRLLVRRITRV